MGMIAASRQLARLCVLAVAVSALPAYGAETHVTKPAAKKRYAAPRIEKLTCMLGSEDRHARIGVELKGGRVESFAYYSKWKPRTCSVAHKRDDAYSQWDDTGRFTTVVTEKGRFLIENRGRDVHFIFHDVDRMFYCGMEGVIRGTLTVTRGRKECVLAGVMDEDSDNTPTLAAAPNQGETQ